MLNWQVPGARTDPARATSPAQVGWLILTLVLVTAPHLPALPGWLTALAFLAAAWRLAVALGHGRLPGPWLRAALTLAGSFAVAFVYRGIAGIDSGSALLILMMALKLLETRSSRDRGVVVLIGWFVLFAAFLREQSLALLPWLGAGLIAGTVALAEGARTGRGLPFGTSLALTGRLLFHGAPLALAMFLLFPRLPGPFWALPTADGQARSGLSGHMAPGDITALALSDEVAFRVRFDGPPPLPAELYWRGPVLERFDGRRWGSLTPPQTRWSRSGPTVPAPQPEPGATSYAYEITLEPQAGRWLLPLESPAAWDVRDAGLSPALELIHPRPIDKRFAWRGRSAGGGRFRPPALPDPVTARYAATRNPRSLALARQLRSEAGSDREFLRRILALFRDQPFRYTLNPPALREHPVDEFLFSTRAGFCEHYASAFALLARAGGLPARIVTGYQGGEYNPLGSYWIIRQSDAHAWTEVWLDGRWERIDPTGAVAPERIERGLEAALPGSATASLPLLGGGAWLSQLALSWDALNAAWDRWVLAFGPDQQAGLLARLGVSAPSLRDIALACALACGGLLLLLTVQHLRQGPERPDPVDQAWGAFCARLARHLRARHPAEGPAEYAAAVAALRPDLAASVTGLAREYLHLRYHTEATPAQVARFRRLVRSVRIPPAPRPG